MRFSLKICSASCVAIASSVVVGILSAQTPVARRVMLDEAHHNIMATASGGYRPLVSVLSDAGFEVTPNALSFGPERLATADVVGHRQSERRRRARSAGRSRVIGVF
jgi:hypothetical protein